MALTKDFQLTVRARASRDREFRREMLREAIDCLLAGEVTTGKIVLRDYINATIGFARLARMTKIPVKSLMRMFGKTGNPQARNLFDVILHLQRAEGVTLTATLHPKGARLSRHAAAL